MDPLGLGQRLVAVLESGQRTATGYLATLMALLEHCVEYLPEAPGEPLTVSVSALAERVLDLYWLQGAAVRGRGAEADHPVRGIDSAAGDVATAGRWRR